MKKLLNYIPFILFSIISINLHAQSQSAAVLSVYTQSAKISPEMAESVLRVEMTKTEQFNVIDKLDMIVSNNCFNDFVAQRQHLDDANLHYPLDIFLLQKYFESSPALEFLVKFDAPLI